MNRVFLTGATGNVGRSVLAELIRQGYDVTAMVRRNTSLEGCRTVTADLADPTPAIDDVYAADAVIHLASPRSLEPGAVAMREMLATASLLEAWQRGNFVYASSQTVYGTPKATLTESTPFKPECWYDLGKVCNEMQLQMAAAEPGRGAAVSVRMALVLGAGPRRLDRQFLPTVVAACRERATFIFDSEGGLETYGSSFIGDEDLALAIVGSLGVNTSGAYNVAGGFCTWRALVEVISSQLGVACRFQVRAGARPESGEYRLPQSRSELNCTSFHTQTNFAPRQTLEELVAAFLAAEAGPRHDPTPVASTGNPSKRVLRWTAPVIG